MRLRRLSGRRHQCGSGQRPRREDELLRRQLRLRLRQRLDDQRQVPARRRRRRHQRAVLRHQPGVAQRRAVQHAVQPGRLCTAGRFGHGDLRRPGWRRRGRPEPERDPPGLVVHPQASEERQQRLPPEQGTVRRQHADGRRVPGALHDGRQVGAGQPDADDQHAQRASDHGELRRRRHHQAADRQPGFPRQRRLQHRPARPRHQQGVLSVRFVAHRPVAVRCVGASGKPGRDQRRVQPHQRRSGRQSEHALQQRGAGV